MKLAVYLHMWRKLLWPSQRSSAPISGTSYLTLEEALLQAWHGFRTERGNNTRTCCQPFHEVIDLISTDRYDQICWRQKRVTQWRRGATPQKKRNSWDGRHIHGGGEEEIRKCKCPEKLRWKVSERRRTDHLIDNRSSAGCFWNSWKKRAWVCAYVTEETHDIHTQLTTYARACSLGTCDLKRHNPSVRPRESILCARSRWTFTRWRLRRPGGDINVFILF